jgi:hypothetical protein
MWARQLLAERVDPLVVDWSLLLYGIAVGYVLCDALHALVDLSEWLQVRVL